MAATPHVRQAVQTVEDVGALRRAVSSLSAELPEVREGTAELVATELATNLLRHAEGGGYVLYRRDGTGLEIVAVDGGPGIPLAERDGAVAPGTGGSEDPGAPAAARHRRDGLHVGLGSVQRIAEAYDCFTHSSGTVVLARLGVTSPAPPQPFRWGAVNVPLGGSGDSGDSWVVRVGRRLGALVVDGLGHGSAAAAAAQAAVSTFASTGFDPDRDNPTAFVRRAHEAMWTTRGGVIGMAVIDTDSATASFVGVGNVAGQVVVDGSRVRLIGRGGVLGTEQPLPSLHLDVCRWGPGATLVLSSDGVRPRWDMSDYPGLLDHDPTVIAATLHRDYGEIGDDATVLVVRDTRSSETT